MPCQWYCYEQRHHNLLTKYGHGRITFLTCLHFLSCISLLQNCDSHAVYLIAIIYFFCVMLTNCSCIYRVLPHIVTNPAFTLQNAVNRRCCCCCCCCCWWWWFECTGIQYKAYGLLRQQTAISERLCSYYQPRHRRICSWETHLQIEPETVMFI